MEPTANNTGRIKGSEIFVGGLQLSVTEDMICEMFSKCGEILEIRMMKDKNGKLKGYCFVRFTSKEGATKAIKEKNGCILQGKKIVAACSSDQDTLFLGNLKKDLKPEEIEKACHEAFQDVVGVDVALAPVTDTSRVNRGFAFVHFANHAAAARAHKIANKSDFVLGDKWRPFVDWAQTDMHVDPDEMAKVKVAYVANLPESVTEEYLKKIFEPFGKIQRVSISRKGSLPIGFVHFCERSDLEVAISKLDGSTVDGPEKGTKLQLQISIANPVDKTKKRRRDEPVVTVSGKGSSLSSKVPKMTKKESGEAGPMKGIASLSPATGMLGGVAGAAHLSSLDSYKYLPFSTGSSLVGLDAYGASSRLFTPESVFSRVPTVPGDSAPYASGLHGLGGYELQIPERRSVKFDPYTGEPFKFDPFTGEPLQPLVLPTSHIAGKYF